MARPKDQRRPPRGNEERATVEAIDELKEFEKFKKDILPSLRDAVMKKKPAKEILETLKSMAAARLGQIIATSTDEKAALSAIDQILNRTDGKPKESVTTTHKFEKLKDEEIDALLKSRIAEASSDTKEEDTH